MSQGEWEKPPSLAPKPHEGGEERDGTAERIVRAERDKNSAGNRTYNEPKAGEKEVLKTYFFLGGFWCKVLKINTGFRTLRTFMP